MTTCELCGEPFDEDDCIDMIGMTCNSCVAEQLRETGFCEEADLIDSFDDDDDELDDSF